MTDLTHRHKTRWYICTLTEEGYKKYRVRTMYVRKSPSNKVYCMATKQVDHITQEEAKQYFEKPDLVANHIQRTLDDLWDKKYNNIHYT